MGIFSSVSDRAAAGIFIFSGVMQYVELLRSGNELVIEKCLDMPYDTGSQSGDVFAERSVIENNLRALRREVGKRWPSKIYAAVQSKDVLLRTVEFPKMELMDIKRSFRFEFDRYFPIPVDDAVYDIAFIDRPAQDDMTQGAVSYCLVSAVRRSAVENLMASASRVGIKFAAIEPAPVSALRCMMGPVSPMGFNVFVLAGITSSMIISTYRDNGLIFRNTTTAFAVEDSSGAFPSDIARDLQATVNFSATQVRGFAPDKVYVGGYGAGLGDAVKTSIEHVVQVPVQTVDPWRAWDIKGVPKDAYGWEVSLGLTLRQWEEI